MGRANKAEFVTYTMVITPATATNPAETAAIKIKKFRRGRARDWLKWSSQFRSLARKKQWTGKQTAHNLVALIEGDLESEVEQAAIDAINTGRNFEGFFADVGQLSVPADFSEDLDNELWTMKKRRDETVIKFSQRLKENVRMFDELPLNAEEAPGVQQCRYLKRGMPRAWQDKLAVADIVHDTFGELVLYFSRIEKAEQQLSTREKKPEMQSQGRPKDQHGDKSASKSQHKYGKKNSDGSKRKHKSNKWCSFHKTISHNTSDCCTVKKKEKTNKGALK
ncbi:Hypothetical protein PHPALM_3207 [Phytophthora palmivora]|uniref:Retrotransposon gag domain-containing protein n=1 Tax=Phytophthora palmivora TaxID=4796 RepID=A0A2P4YN44_9STRA|nr:Hypothetical protein PHPALM_3207 [Phytophthora palmivora]